MSKENDLRWIEVKPIGTNKKKTFGYFHTWAGLSEHAIAIVEDTDGVVHFYSSINHVFRFLRPDYSDMKMNINATIAEHLEESDA